MGEDLDKVLEKLRYLNAVTCLVDLSERRRKFCRSEADTVTQEVLDTEGQKREKLRFLNAMELMVTGIEKRHLADKETMRRELERNLVGKKLEERERELRGSFQEKVQMIESQRDESMKQAIALRERERTLEKDLAKEAAKKEEVIRKLQTSLNEAMATADSLLEENSKLMFRVQCLEAEKTEGACSADDERNRTDLLKKELLEKTDTIGKLLNEIEVSRTTIGEKEGALAESARQLEEARRELGDVKETLKVYEDGFATQKHKDDKVQKELDSLRQDKEKLVGKLAASGESENELKKRNASMREKLDSLEQQKVVLESQFQGMKIESELATKKLSLIEKAPKSGEADDVNMEFAMILEETTKQFTKKLEDKDSRIVAMTKELDAMKEQISQMASRTVGDSETIEKQIREQVAKEQEAKLQGLIEDKKREVEQIKEANLKIVKIATTQNRMKYEKEIESLKTKIQDLEKALAERK